MTTSRKSARSEASAVAAESVTKKSSKASSVMKIPARLHKCSFFPYQPAAIGQITTSPAHTLPQVAVLRKSEPPVVEVYTPSSDWMCEIVIPGRSGDDFECMCMVGPSLAEDDDSSSDEENVKMAKPELPVFEKPSAEKLNIKHILPLEISSSLPQARLFTAGVDGRIREWNLKDGGRQETFSLDVVGGAIWCMAVSPDQDTIAVGSEDGRVRLFSVLPRSLEFLRGFESGDADRILSLAWSQDGSRIVAGSAGGQIRVFDTRTGRTVFSIRAERKNRKEVTSVWAVAFVGNEYFVTGHSTGHVQFWDTMTGVQLQDFPTFGADVLSLAVVGGKQVFATGIDHKIVEFSLIKTENIAGFTTEKWLQGGKRYYHTHDVRSLATLNLTYQEPKTGKLVARPVLMSGGVDCSLVGSDPFAFAKAIEDATFNAHQRRLLPFPRHAPVVKMAVEDDCIYLAGQMRNTVQVWCILGSKTQHLASVNISRYESVTSFAISPNGQFLCILTPSEWKLFQLPSLDDMNDGEVTVEKIENVPTFRLAKNASAPHLCHFMDVETLLLINSHEIVRISLADMTVKDITPLPTAPERIRQVCSRDQSLALLTTNTVSLFTVGKTVKSVNTLPKHKYAITASAFVADNVLAFADCRNAIIKVNTANGSLISETLNELCSDWKVRREPIMGISAHGSEEGKLSCWTESCISQVTFPSGSNKKRSQEITSRMVKDHYPLIFFAHLPSGDSVVIERPWMSIVENFPPAFYRNRYGAQ